MGRGSLFPPQYPTPLSAYRPRISALRSCLGFSGMIAARWGIDAFPSALAQNPGDANCRLKSSGSFCRNHWSTA